MSASQNNGLQTYKRLISAAKPYWYLFVFGAIGTVVISLTDAGFAWLVKPIINKGFVNRDEVFIHWLPLMILIIFVVRGISSFASGYYITRVARTVVRDFRRLIFDKLLHLPASFYGQNSSGYLLSAIVYNVEQVSQACSGALLTCLREASLAIALIIVMFSVSWQLTLLFLVIAPLIAWVVKWSSKRMRRLSSNVQQSVGDVTHVASEGVEGYQVIRLYGGQTYEKEKFHKATKANLQRDLKVVVTNSVGTASVQFLFAVPIAVTLLFATMPSLGVSPGSFAAMVTAMITLLRPVRRMTMVNSDIQKGVAAAESIFHIADEAPEKDTGKKTIGRAKGDMVFNDVCFEYNTSKQPVLKHINFTVKSGETVAIVGRSGGGKSTLVHLLPRFYEIDSGSITLDGTSIYDYRLSDLRQQFAFVSQNTMLFDDTIANNIAYGLSGKVDKKQIIAAAEAAHAIDFISELPDGFDTFIGENGVLLSGGQRQRIAIARALLKDAPILILDEATASLDTHSEKHIQAALEELMQDRTTLVIAHRLSTIENADKIVVLDAGKIAEQGTHADLVAKEFGIYASLHHAQFKETNVAL